MTNALALKRKLQAKYQRHILQDNGSKPQRIDSLVDLGKRVFGSGWKDGKHIDLLNDELLKVVAGETKRLIIEMPPRHAKTTMACQLFVPIYLRANPEKRIIFTTYQAGKAAEWGRKCRDIIDQYQDELGIQVRQDSRASHSWNLLGTRGGMLTAGVGGPLIGSGADTLIIDDPCIAEGQRVRTKRGLIPIENVIIGDEVLTHKARWRKVTAVYNNGVKEIVQLSTKDLKVLLTPTHKVYTNSGWIEAQKASNVYAETVPAVWSRLQNKAIKPDVLQYSMPRCFSEMFAKAMSILQKHVSTLEGFCHQVLFSSVRVCCEKNSSLSCMPLVQRKVSNQPASNEILQHSLQTYCMGSKAQRPTKSKEARASGKSTKAGGNGYGTKTMQFLRYYLSATLHLSAILLACLQKLCSFGSHERKRKCQFSTWPRCELVQQGIQEEDNQNSKSEIQALHVMRGNEESLHSPHRREQDEQCNRQPSLSVSLMPSEVAQVKRYGMARVYDITVEEDHSFVAEGIVVHNCKNHEEADSPLQREKLWEWLHSTALTRLEPNGSVIVIMHRWRRDDVIGQIKNKAVQTGENWKVLTLPAIAKDNDILGRKPGDVLWPQRFTQAELEERQKTTAPRWWHSLYQQDPQLEEGAEWPASWFQNLWVDDFPPANELQLKVLSLDPSKGKTDKLGDYSAYVVLAYGKDQCIYIGADMDNRRSAERIVDDGLQLVLKHKPDAFALETNASQDLFGVLFQKEAARQNIHIRFHKEQQCDGPIWCEYHHSRSKVGRIREWGQYINPVANKVRFVRSMPQSQLLMDQFMMFPTGKSDPGVDDGPDSAALALECAMEISHIPELIRSR